MTDRQSLKTEEQTQVCGCARGVVFDNSRPAWQGGGPRPVQWSVWYPLEKGAIFSNSGASAADFFDPGAIALEAPLTDSAAQGVFLLSHGTGGTADSIGWIARLLAARGNIVIAPNHHGNTGLEAYSPEGFVCWWERATDLSFLLGHFAADLRFGPHIGQAPVTVIGYSLGAYAALALLGGLTSMQQFNDFTRDHPAMARGPREFPDLAERVAGLFETSAAFRQSWERHSQPFRDTRVTAAILLAPPTPVRAFTPASIAAIIQPVSILSGMLDHEADPGFCAAWLRAQNPAFTLDMLEGVDHYAFLGPLTPRGTALLASLIGNTSAQDRALMHAVIWTRLLDCVLAQRQRAQAEHKI